MTGRRDEDLPVLTPTIRSLTGGDHELSRHQDAIVSVAGSQSAIDALEQRCEELLRIPAPVAAVEILITDVSAQRLALRAEMLRLKNLAIIALATDQDGLPDANFDDLIERYRTIGAHAGRLSGLLASLRAQLP